MNTELKLNTAYKCIEMSEITLKLFETFTYYKICNIHTALNPGLLGCMPGSAIYAIPILWLTSAILALSWSMYRYICRIIKPYIHIYDNILVVFGVGEIN